MARRATIVIARVEPTRRVPGDRMPGRAGRIARRVQRRASSPGGLTILVSIGVRRERPA
jgi:hypothetical protein